MKTQKIIKVGNSKGVILPTDFIKSVRLKAGDKLEVMYNKTYHVIFMTPEKHKSKITKQFEFFTWLEEYTEKYKDLLKELAKY